MRVAIGADHTGVKLKAEISRLLHSLGIEHRDFGTASEESVDYPDFAERVAKSVAQGKFDRGILVCGTGVGMSIAANKIAGIRAAPVTDVLTARAAREHNNLNVLTLGARGVDAPRALEIVRAFLETPYAAGRHEGRLHKITALEASGGRSQPAEPSSASPGPTGDRAGNP